MQFLITIIFSPFIFLGFIISEVKLAMSTGKEIHEMLWEIRK